MTGETFYVTGGTLAPDAPSYLPRAADVELLDALFAGELCYLLNARQMGKSSLCLRTRQALTARGIRTVFLDLQKFGSSATPEQWFNSLLQRIGLDLKLRAEFLKYWRENADRAPLDRLFGAITDVGLAHDDSRLVIFLDEVDVVRSLPFATDEFFGAIRESYNERAANPDLQRLTFCLVGSALQADLVADTRLSPFNVGRQLDLHDFTVTELSPLSASMGTNGAALLARVFHWTAGHPFLTQSVCAAVATSGATKPADVDAVVADEFFTRTARRDVVHLADVSNRMLSRKAGEIDPADDRQKADILALYEQIWRGKKPTLDDARNPLVGLLKLSGIVSADAGMLTVRNRIYQRIFDAAWIAESRPDSEARRQREAVARARWQVGFVACGVLIAMAALTGWALNSTRIAVKARTLADSLLQQQTRQKAEVDSALAISVRETQEARKQAGLALSARNAALDAASRADAARKAEAVAKSAAIASATQARASAAAAILSSEQTKKLDYISTINLAQRNVDSGDYVHAEQLLDSLRGSRERGFEWEYLNDQCHTELKRVPASRFELSPDGLTVALMGQDTITFVDLETGATKKVIKVPGLRDMDYTSDPREVLVVYNPRAPLSANPLTSSTCVVSRLDPLSGNLAKLAAVANPADRTSYAPLIYVSPSRRCFAVAVDSRNVGLWDAESGHLIGKFPIDAAIDTIAISQDLKRIAISESRDKPYNLGPVVDNAAKLVGHISLWSVPDRRKIWTTKRWEAHSAGRTRSMRFSGDGRDLFVQGSEEASVLRTTDGSSEPGWPVELHLQILAGTSHDGRHIAMAGADHTVQTINFAGEKGKLLQLPELAALIEYSTDDRRLVVGGISGTVYLVDVATGADIRRFKGLSSEPVQVAASADGRRVVATRAYSADGDTRLWFGLEPRDSNLLDGFLGFVDQVSFLPGDVRVAASGEFYPLREAEIVSSKTLATWPDLNSAHGQGTGTAGAMAVSPDGSRFAVLRFPDNKAANTGQVELRLTSRENNKPIVLALGLAAQDGSDFTSASLAFSKDGLTVLGLVHGRLRKWLFSTGREMPAPLGSARIVSLSGDGRWALVDLRSPAALSAGSQMECEVRDLETGTANQRFSLKHDSTKYTFSADGRLLANFNIDCEVVVRSAFNGRELVRLKGHSDQIAGIAFSADGKRLATRGEDYTVRIWDLSTGRLLLSIRSSLGFGKGPGIAFSHDGLSLAVSQQSGVRILRNRSIPSMRLRESPAEMIAMLKRATVPIECESLLDKLDSLLHRDYTFSIQAAEMLNTAAWTIVDPDAKQKPDPAHVAAARRAAERAVELTLHRNAYMLDTLAAARFESSDAPGALSAEQEAIKVMPTDKNVRAALEANLHRYEMLAAAASTGGQK